MSGLHESDIERIKAELNVGVAPGFGSVGPNPEPDTHIWVRPRLTGDEYDRIFEKAGIESDLGRLMVAGTEAPGITVFYADGKLGPEHTDLAAQLAREVVAVRGLEAACVTTRINDDNVQNLIVAAQ